MLDMLVELFYNLLVLKFSNLGRRIQLSFARAQVIL